MTFQQFLLILRARYKVALFTLLVTVVTTLVVSLLLPKQYTASAAVVIDVRSPDPIGGMVLPGLATPAYMATQVDIINSDRVAQRVVKLLRMDESPVIREQWMEATDGVGDLTHLAGRSAKAEARCQTIARKQRHQYRIQRRRALILPPTVANAFAQAYFDVNLDLKVAPARQSASWFEDQTKSGA